MAKYCFMASVENLRIDKPIGRGWEIAGPLRITNSQSVAGRLVNMPFRDQAGNLEARAFLSGKPFVYAIGEYPLEDDSVDGQGDLLLHHLRQMQILFQTMWMVKDHAANFSLGFVQYPYRHPLPAAAQTQVSSQTIGIRYSNAELNTEEVVFAEEELQTALELYKGMYAWTFEKTLKTSQPMGLQRDSTRFERAMYFLQAARGASSIPEKIAFYCICFETLVSTDSVELSHKVSERVALILGDSSTEPVQVYSEIKKAYNTRSRIVHGGKLSNDSDWYAAQSRTCDDLLRNLMNRLARDQDLAKAIEQSQEKVNTYFLKLIFEKGG